MGKIIYAAYHAKVQVLEIRLSDIVSFEDIETWKLVIRKAVAEIPDNSEIRVLVNLFGFKAENVEVHKAYRNIIPLLLADFGYRIGYLDLFPEASLELSNHRGIRCVAMANVHQDATKMSTYQERFSTAREQYFTDQEAAVDWIFNQFKIIS